MSKPKYKSYKDFLKDDEFVKWQMLKESDFNEYWQTFRENHPEYTTELDKAIEIFKSAQYNNYSMTAAKRDALSQKLEENINRSKRRKLLFRYATIVASLSLFVLISTQIYNNSTNVGVQSEVIFGEKHDSQRIQFINSERTVALDQNVELKITEDGSITVFDEEGQPLENLKLNKESLNKLIVPYGKRSSLTLADGTKVWLNSGSELEFPSAFDATTRDIYMNGEIYIDVAKNIEKAFYVHTSQFDIQVLGTKFNVQAYKDEEIKNVVLVEGEVKVKTLNQRSENISPNEKLSIGLDGLKKTKVNTAEYTSWIDGIFYFEQASLNEILYKVGRYYNISFKEEKLDFAQLTYSGKLVLSDNIDDVMTAISAFSSTTYEITDNQILIREKK